MPAPGPAAPHLPSSTEPRWRQPRCARAAAMVRGLGNYRNNLPAVRQYLETFATLIYLKFPTLVEEQLISIFHDNGMRQQALSSYVFIATSVILHSWELAAQINHLNQLLPPVLPFLTSHHHSLRGFTQQILYIVLSWKARSSMSLAVKLRYILKLLSAAAWVIILPVTYAYTSENPTGLARTIKSWLGDGRNQPSLYILAAVVYLAPNMLAATLFLSPVLRRALERSNLKVITFMMWWSQPRLFAYLLAEECMKAHSPFSSIRCSGSFYPQN